MRRALPNRLIGFVLLALLAAMPTLALQQSPEQNTGQSQTTDALADAARKAREQKKEAPKPKKVFTNDDFAPAAPSAQPSPATQSPAQPGNKGAEAQGGSKEGAASKDSGTAKEDPNSEAAWRKRFADQRAKIAKAQAELDVLQRELQKTQVQYYPDPQKAMEQQYSRKDVNDKQAKIDAKKQEIAQLQQELSDMEDQMKKTGGDPGWARE